MKSDSSTTRDGLAIIANCMTPYRANLHSLLAEGIPELKLHTMITHGPADFDWSVDLPKSINASFFGEAQDSPIASRLRSPIREWRKGGRLIDYLHEHRARAVICSGYQYLSYLRIIQHCHRQNIPLFVHNDSNIKAERRLSTSRQLIKKQVYALWMPRVQGVMSMGEFGDEFFLKYGADPRRIYRVPYTPDYDLYANVDGLPLKQFRRKHGLPEGRRHILYSGRLVPVKRVDLLIDAFVAVAERRPEWDLLIVGDGRLREDLSQSVPVALRPRVKWTGFLQRSEIVAAYHAATVCVLPSDFEPWAVVVQEAMAAGRTVVASDVVGAAHELIVDKVSGRIFPVGDLAALTEAMLEVTDDSKVTEYQAQSLKALAEWRERVNPVAEIRRALVDVGILEN